MNTTKSIGYWRTAWIEFKKDKLALAGLLIIVLLFGVAIFDNFLAGNKPLTLRWSE